MNLKNIKISTQKRPLVHLKVLPLTFSSPMLFLREYNVFACSKDTCVSSNKTFGHKDLSPLLKLIFSILYIIISVV